MQTGEKNRQVTNPWIRGTYIPGKHFVAHLYRDTDHARYRDSQDTTNVVHFSQLRKETDALLSVGDRIAKAYRADGQSHADEHQRYPK